MYKILLVEDEPILIESIRKTINEMNTHFRVEACALNGIEALKILGKSRFDVLITDVMMPVMNGFELIGKVRDILPYIIPVILSGYHEFEYTHEAIKLKVEDYIVKPVNSESLMELFMRLENKIDSYRKELQLKYLNSLSIEGIYSPKIPDYFSHYSGYLLLEAVLSAGNTDSNKDYKECIEELVKVKNEINQYFICQKDVWVLNMAKQNKIRVIFGFTGNKKNSADIASKEIICIFEKYGIVSTLSLCHCQNNAEELLKGIKFCSTSNRINKVIGKSKIIISEGRDASENNLVQGNITAAGDLSEISSQLPFLLLRKNINLIIDVLNDLIFIFKKDNYAQIRIEETMIELFRLLADSKMISGVNDEEIRAAVSDSICYEGLREKILDIITRYHKQELDYPLTLYSQRETVLDMGNYIKQNYLKMITLNDLAKRYNMSPSYISKIFKKHYGKGPIDYLIYLRMNKAKELLVNYPEMQIKDICSIVGYTDQLYFSSYFKHVIGCSPSEYRKRKWPASQLENQI